MGRPWIHLLIWHSSPWASGSPFRGESRQEWGCTANPNPLSWTPRVLQGSMGETLHKQWDRVRLRWDLGRPGSKV